MIPITALCAVPYRPRVSVTISSNTANYTLSTASVPGYVAGYTDVVLTVSSGVYVYSLDATLPALTIDGSFAVGDSITVVNQGYIFGGGGNGVGVTVDGGGLVTVYDAQNGGSAISTSKSFALNNQSYIGGGGGGGGGVVSTVTGLTDYRVAGGGGGAGGGDSLPGLNGASAVNTDGTAGAQTSVSLTLVACSGGGGGTKPFGSYTLSPYAQATSAGAIQGIGGNGGQCGGSGGVYIYNQNAGLSYGYGGAGGGANGVGYPGQPGSWTGGTNGWVACGGGGGGWGQAGGAGAYLSYSPNLEILSPGTAGKAIALNGNTVTYIANNTIWGPVA